MAKIGRNDPCPCGSGMKFKKCQGRGDIAPAGYSATPARGEFALVGLPGISERITVVPVFEEGPKLPDNPSGAPGKYEVALLFTRPFAATSPKSISLTPDAEGDSHIRWLMSPPAGSSDFHLKIAAHVDSRLIEYHLRPNSRGFLARADACFEAKDFQDAEDAAYRGPAPILRTDPENVIGPAGRR